jgi:hypothetical protein
MNQRYDIEDDEYLTEDEDKYNTDSDHFNEHGTGQYYALYQFISSQIQSNDALANYNRTTVHLHSSDEIRNVTQEMYQGIYDLLNEHAKEMMESNHLKKIRKSINNPQFNFIHNHEFGTGRKSKRGRRDRTYRKSRRGRTYKKGKTYRKCKTYRKSRK